MTDQELRDLVASLAADQKETDKQLQKSVRQIELTAVQLKQTNRQLGELGNKWGSFTEGLAAASMAKVLQKEFGMKVVTHNALARQNGHSLEVDVLAHSDEEHKSAFVVAVKSHLTSEAIAQILKTIAALPKFFAYLADFTVYGLLAAVKIPENVRQEALKQGLYLAQISDATFKLQVPRNFKPHAFTPATKTANGHKPKKKK